MSAPIVSIVIPTHNRESLLPRALRSVEAQTYDDWEIVLVDDGSTDGTESAIRPWRERWGERFVVIRQVQSGSSAARNRGIDQARGRFICFLDSDDEFLPRKLERQLELFHRRPELGFVYSDYSYIDERGDFHPSAIHDKHPLARRVPHQVVATGLCVCSGSLFPSLIEGYFVATIVGMVRREVLGFDIRFPDSCGYAEEWLFYLRVARRTAAGFVEEPLCVHHHVSGSLARTDKAANTRGRREILRKVLKEFPDLSTEQRNLLIREQADVCRQIAYDSLRKGRRGTAFRYFAESCLHRPRIRTVRELLGAAVQWRTPNAGAV